MSFKAHELYQEYEDPNKYKTSTEKKVERALEDAKEEGLGTRKETVNFQEMKELFGKNFLGPEAVEKTFGVPLAEVPEIPFSVEELERAEKLGQMLLLRVDKTAEGKPMSLEAMTNILTKRWKDAGMGELLNSADGWKSWIGEDFFMKEAPRMGWALVSKDVLPESLRKNYLEQTEVIIATLKNEAFKGMDMPEEYEKAIAEFELKKDKLAKLMNDDWQKAAKELLELKITKLTRQTVPETIYDLAMYYDANNERLLSDKYTWAASLDPDGRLVALGTFDARGVLGRRCYPDARYGYLGVSLSRRL